MRPAVCLLATLAFGFRFWAEDSRRHVAPSYSAAGVVNAASNVVGDLAPNTFATIYGSDLSFFTRILSSEDLRGDRLPTSLGGVTVFIGPIPALMYYVSPKQINLLIPSILDPGEYDLRIVREGLAGPAVRIALRDVAPALFQLDQETAVATTADWSLITRESPAEPGRYVVLWATGLGPTNPDTIYGYVPPAAAWLRRLGEFQVLLDGVAVESNRVTYAGVAPGWAGLYQINVKLPEQMNPDPEIQIGLGGQVSPSGLRLPVRAE